MITSSTGPHMEVINILEFTETARSSTLLKKKNIQKILDSFKKINNDLLLALDRLLTDREGGGKRRKRKQTFVKYNTTKTRKKHIKTKKQRTRK